MRWLWVLVVSVFLAAGTAAAENREVAREAFHEGSLQYDLGDFKAALAAFKRAYLNFEDPVILFNIGQCQRLLGDKADALRSFRVFLSKLPDTKQRPQVERLIADLQSAIDQDKAAATRPPIGTMGPSPSIDPQPSPAAAVVVSTPALRSEKRPKKKTWIWGVVAGGAVLIAGAIALGVVLGAPRSNFVELTY